MIAIRTRFVIGVLGALAPVALLAAGTAAGQGGAGEAYDLRVDVVGDGVGYVTSPVGIDCAYPPRSDCAERVPAGTEVTLTAHPDEDNALDSWGATECDRELTCTFTMSRDRSITAIFVRDPQPPVIESLAVTPRRFAPSTIPTFRKPQRGTTIKAGVSEPGNVTIRIRRDPPRTDVPPGAKPRVFTREVKEGMNAIRFTGFFRKPLKPGRYQAVAVMTDGIGLRSEKARAKFRVVR